MDIKKRNVRGPYSSGCSWVVMKSPSSVVVIRDEIHVSLANNTQPDPNNMLSWRDIGEYRANVLFIIYFSLAFLIFSFPFPIFFFLFSLFSPPLDSFFGRLWGIIATIRKRERERWIRSSADPRDKCIIPKEIHIGIKAPRSHHSPTPVRTSTTLTWKYPLLPPLHPSLSTHSNRYYKDW